MKLTQYRQPAPPTIKLSQRSANKLVALYYEMVTVSKSNGELEFDQDDCDTCVIGNALRAGVIKVRDPRPSDSYFSNDFGRAVESIGLPEEFETEDRFIRDGVSDFLFGGLRDIHELGDEIQLNIGRRGNDSAEDDDEWVLDELDACIRIAGVLDRAGYEVTDLPNLPRVK